jgi:tRNA(Ile)-lysidine synthase
MLPVNGQIIRPLLGESRACIEAYLTGKGVKWREDETNADTAYTRNYLRSQILPRLEQGVNAAASLRISQFASACAEAEDYLAAAADKALERCRTAFMPGDRLLIPESCLCRSVLLLDALLEEDPYLQGRILYRCLAGSTQTGRDIGTVHVDALRRLCRKKTDGQLSMPDRVVVLKSAGKLFFCRRTEATEADPQPHAAPGAAVPTAGRIYPAAEAEYTVRVRDFDGSMSSIPRNEYTKWFDYDKIGMFPVFRTRQPGDYMYLYAHAKTQRGGGSLETDRLQDGSEKSGQPGEMIAKKLARIMLDGKVSAGARDRIVLPFIGKEALWVPGLRMGDSCKVTPATGKILEIRWNSGRDSAQNHTERGEKDGLQNRRDDQ